jgi:hypothetical protein
MMHLSGGLLADACESRGKNSHALNTLLEPPDGICELARGPPPPPLPAKDSAVDFCHDICTIVYIDKRKNLLIFLGPLASLLAPCSSKLPLQDSPPGAGTSETPDGGRKQPLVSS